MVERTVLVMIIGTGLIASACRNIDHKGLTIYASGVSDSREKRYAQFKRERDLLMSVKGKIVYFSTICPIITPYTIHKKRMEQLLKPDDLIIRLGCIVGKAGNPTNLFNFIESKLSAGQVIPVYKDAVRGFIDVDDLAELVDVIKNKEGIVNVPGIVSAKVWDVVLLMARYMKVTAHIKINEPDQWEWDWDIPYNNDYIELLIRKYNGYRNSNNNGTTKNAIA